VNSRLRVAVRGICAMAALSFATGAAAQAYPPGRYGAPPPPRPAGAVPAENVNFAYADVLRVDPIYEVFEVMEPREECYDERVVTREPGGGDPTGGTIAGAIIGGVLGNQIGSGSGRRAATAAGAVIGGTVGRNVDQRNGGPDRQYEGTERRCRVINEPREERRAVGYDVEYRYRGEVYMSRLDYDPGDRLRVRVSVTPAD
jgi:uncharacterized protein YcfJ